MTQEIMPYSRNRVQRLVSDRILDSFDFTDFDVCVECVKGRKTKTKRLGDNKSMEALTLIHLDICRSFPIAS